MLAPDFGSEEPAAMVIIDTISVDIKYLMAFVEDRRPTWAKRPFMHIVANIVNEALALIERSSQEKVVTTNTLRFSLRLK